MIRGLAIALLLLAGCGGAAPVVPRDVVLISIDTLRADHLGSYGYERPTSPVLDALAEEAIVFERAWATAPWTLPSHASMLTGLYPSRHGAREKRTRMRRDARTLAEILQREGFATGGVINGHFVARRFGLARGFDFHHRVPESETPEGAASRVNEHGLRWLASQEGRTFLFLHYFDVHGDYQALPEFERLFTSSGELHGTVWELHELNQGKRPAREEDVAHLIGLYDASIRQLDSELGVLFDGLRRLGRWDETLLIVTSDHGEEFGDHGRFSHGYTHYEEMLRIPLLVRWPGGPRGVRVEQPVSLVDLVPTILAGLGIETPADLDGVDLSPSWRGGGLEPRPIFAETGPLLRDELRSVRLDDAKLVVQRAEGTRSLYDLASDPGERRDVSDEQAKRAERLSSALEDLERRALPPGQSLGLPKGVLEQLRALGYGGTEDDTDAP